MPYNVPKILIGCAATFVGVLLLLGVGCVGFNRWLKSPGELLEPTELLDANASGYLEWRLELENPATAQLVETLFELLEQQQASAAADQPAVLKMFMSWNQRRQEKDFKRLFPSTAAWTLYPGETHTEDHHLFSVSIQGAGHQIVFADWLLGLIAPRISDFPSIELDGETVLVLEDPETAGPPPTSRYGFLHRKGVFFGSDKDAVEYAIQRLNQPIGGAADPTFELESLYRDLSEDLQIRGAMVNSRNEIGRVVENLFPERIALADSLGEVVTLTIGGGVDQAGDASLTLLFEGGPESLAEEITLLIEETTEFLAEEEIELVSRVASFPSGWQVHLQIEDLPSIAERLTERAHAWDDNGEYPPVEDPSPRVEPAPSTD